METIVLIAALATIYRMEPAIFVMSLAPIVSQALFVWRVNLVKMMVSAILFVHLDTINLILLIAYHVTPIAFIVIINISVFSVIKVTTCKQQYIKQPALLALNFVAAASVMEPVTPVFQDFIVLQELVILVVLE